jgi:hypothetical protein
VAWTDWTSVAATCADAAGALLEAVADGVPGWDDLG